MKAAAVITCLVFNPITVLWGVAWAGHALEFDHQWWTLPYVITSLVLLALSGAWVYFCAAED